MERKIELLAPGGDVDSIKAAILAGADAVYCGLDKFNARNRAANISFDELQGVIKLAHEYNCEIFLTINIVILEREIKALITLLNRLVNTNIDGVIIQDLGLFYILSNYFKTLPIHASTQATTHNEGQIKFLSKLNATRVNLSRELNLKEIKHLTSVATNSQVLTEVFVHGSQCISFSGICYMSSVIGGNSGNRGRCSQPCRDKYLKTSTSKEYPLNLKDNSAFFSIPDLYKAGVYSLKIEGRIKKYDYIYTVVNTYKKQINSWINQRILTSDNDNLHKVFNRDFSSGYLKGSISNEMFIDNPRDHSIKHISEINNFSSAAEKEKSELKFYTEKDQIKDEIEHKIKQLNIDKTPLHIYVSGDVNATLKVTIKTPDTSFDLFSESTLTNKGTEALGYNAILKRLKAINDTDYLIADINLDHLSDKLYLPFKELTSIKNQLLFLLNGSKKAIEPVVIPSIENHASNDFSPTVSVIISEIDDIALQSKKDITFYFKLPSSLKSNFNKIVDIFNQADNLIPWFPPVLIGDEYEDALKFIDEVKPKLIVTDNTGVAFEAYKRGIEWIAGPGLNTINSYSLLCLKEHFSCSGAFISNELSRVQIKSIKKPKDFKLFYNIYHPIVLMTSRQCLSQQIIGCHKQIMDEDCTPNCTKTSSITNDKGISFTVEKSKGNHHQIYNNENYLNIEIVKDLPQKFDSFFVDLSEISTETKITVEKTEIIDRFSDLLTGNTTFYNKLNTLIHPTTNAQYHKGI